MEKTNCKACSGSWKHNRMISAGWRLSILGFLRREASRCRLGSAAARRGSSRRQPLALTSSARAGGRAASSVAGQPRAGPLGRNGGPANAEAPGCCAPRSLRGLVFRRWRPLVRNIGLVNVKMANTSLQLTWALEEP
ncbi:Protein of unknown function [Gryllus bimaculatus]|nr:Protein of unknown function [Gryllus bimaculatus]